MPVTWRPRTSIFQRQFAKVSKHTSIPEWGAGGRRTAPKAQLGSDSGSSSSITRLLARTSSTHDNPRFRRASKGIEPALHGTLCGLAKYQAQGLVDGTLQLEASALVELEVW